MEAVLNLVIFFVLLVLGLIVGGLLERKHYKSIRTREAQLRRVLVFNEKVIPPGAGGGPCVLVHGSVVISSDYFKTFAAFLRNLFGGNMKSFETLLDRGRREAILRMKAQAKAQGANAVFNVRFATSSMNQNQRKGGLFCCEVMAYGTAVRLPRKPAQPGP